MSLLPGALSVALLVGGLFGGAQEPAPERHLYWGDTHLHTSYSFDAYLFNNRATGPDAAYRYAKGIPVIHSVTKRRVQIDTPLDFLVVADHAELTGVPKRIFEQDALLMNTAFGKRIMPMMKQGRGIEVFSEVVNLRGSGNDNAEFNELESPQIRRPVWDELVDAAEAHNDPGNFTALIGWEWSSRPDAANLHRVVFMANDGDVAKQFLPYSSSISYRPEDLWSWLEKTEAETGAEFIAIPHNSNISKGLMFAENDSEGRPITAEYARTRLRWEPVAEITQYKGDSETHPLLSPSDEFADFESYRHLIDTRPETDHTATVTEGDYVRSALRRGLEIEHVVGDNPYKFGLIGATDSHTSLASAEETNFFNKFPMHSTPAVRSALVPGQVDGPIGWNFAAQGLAGVWAEENTRQALVDAFKRKEVFATTGPRMMVRFFGGWNFRARDAKAKDIGKRGYGKGIPMGGDLASAPSGKAPSFLVQAVRDPLSGNLDRLQMVKGWVDAGGASHETVYNIAASGGRTVDAAGNLPSVGNTVDLATGHFTNDIGAAELIAVWSDPDFDPSQRAFYYVRVLEIPTPRHSLLDAIALKREHPEDIPATIQERAYTSPIWYTP